MKFKGDWAAPDRLAESAAALVLCAAMLVGGGSRGAGDALVHLAMLPAFAFAITRWQSECVSPRARWFSYICVAAIALALVQLLPTPPSVFAWLPGREGLLRELEHAGASVNWRPMTLDRWGSVRSLLALVTFTASWGLFMTLEHRARVRLLKIALVVAVAMSLLGYAQAAAGVRAFRPFDYHHTLGALGVFANRNHFACLMAMLLPLAIWLGAQMQTAGRLPIALASYAAASMLFLAAALSYSRSGLALASMAAIASLMLLRPKAVSRQHRSLGRLLIRHVAPIAFAALSILGVAVYAWDGISERLARDPLQDLRWQYVRHGWRAAIAYLPWGSGLGSFESVYALFEPVTSMREVYARHAHNEPIELLAEAGIPAVSLILAMLAALIAAVRKSLIERESGSTILAVTVVAALVPLVHSLVDYPLRTHAVAVVFALVMSMAMSDAHDLL